MKVKCFFCGGEIESGARTTKRSVSGWEEQRVKGGANAIILRLPGNDFACTPCVDRERRGVNANQRQMFP